MPDFDTFKQTKYFGSLDALRCLSILAVIWHHTGASYFPDSALAGRGHLGVQLFFAISGFLITTLLLRERERHGGISLRDFYLRRSLRIFPLYYTVLLIYTLLVVVVETDAVARAAFFRHLPYYLTYTSNWFVEPGEGRVIFFFAWSLATEEQFYLVWPPLEKYAGERRALYVMLVVIAFILAAYSGLTNAVLPVGSFAHTVISSIALPICMGVVIAHLLHSRRGFEIVGRILGYRWASAMVALALITVLCGPGYSEPLIFALMALLVLTCVIREDHMLSRFYRWRMVQHIGVVSYGMYLAHMLAFNAMKRVTHAVDVQTPLVLFSGTVILTAGVASLSFCYYESWFRRFKERFAR
ncbi:MAG: acyltransferase [Phycisphaerae bacterium]|nr:acyltransferase [Phycisphaerae bacterium]